jgi:glutamine cyclotransferase
MSDGTDRLTFRDPATFEAIGFVDVTDAGQPITHLNELEYIRGEVWANIWLTDRIVIIDPATGAVNATVDLAGLLPPEDRTPDSDVLNGIAFDDAANRVFLTGKKWPALFEVQLVPPRTSAIDPALLPVALTTNS